MNIFQRAKERIGEKIHDSFYAALAVILVVLISFSTLFIRPVIGMADNGDFFRIISENGLYHIPKDERDIFIGYFNKNYGIYKYYNESEKMISSTHSILIKAALGVDKLITGDDVFDIRYLAMIYAIILAAASYLIIRSLTSDINSELCKLGITLLYVFIFCDTGYLAYFNSFYGEAMNISFFLLSIGLLMYMYSFRKINLLYIVMFSASSFLFIGSKQQLAPVGILTAVILIRLVGIAKNKVLNTIALASAVCIIAASAYFYFSITGQFDYINRYHAMTRGVLLYEKDPEAILKEFNINPQYSMLQENIFYNRVPVINPNDDKLQNEFYDKYSFASILGFYLKNPSSFLKMIKLTFENSYSIRPTVLGNYEKIEGRAFGERSQFFSLWSSFKAKYMPHSFGFTILLIVIYFTYAVRRYIKNVKVGDLGLQLLEEALFYVVLVGLSQIFISFIGAGDADLSKHVFMFNISFDIMLIYSITKFMVLKTKKSK